MIELSNSASQTIAAGANLTFNTTVFKTGCSECHRGGSGSVTLRNTGSTYQITFCANVTGTTADTAVQLVIALDGDPLNETTMISTPGAANSVNNVNATTLVSTCCSSSSTITVTNNGSTAIIISANPMLLIRRI